VDDDHDWVEKRRRRSRIQAVVAAVVILSLLGFWLFRTGQKKTQREKTMSDLETLVSRADFESLKEAASRATQAYSDDLKAPPELLTIDLRAQMLLYVIYTGDDARKYKGKESLTEAQERAEDSPAILLAEALFEATTGSPEAALQLLDGGAIGDHAPDWQGVVRSEALLRKGDLSGAAAAVAALTSPAARTWTIRVAWRQGDLDTIEAAAKAILTEVPEHQYASVMLELVSARRAADEASLQRLGAMLETGEPLSALNAALVTVETSRLMRRAGKVQQADELLERFLAADEGSRPLQEEYARVQRYRGLFGAARVRADKALRSRADDPGLLAEMAEAAFFNDAGAMIKDRVRQAPSGSEKSEGVIRALALASIIENSAHLAIPDLRATRHIGMPGEAELWLAEALIRKGKPEEARQEAARAVELLLAASGEGTNEVAIARMYEGLAIAMTGEVDAAREIMHAAFVEPNQTPWGAWLFARFHEVAEDLPGAKNAYLLACHNGQDFALACYDLARIYDSLPASALHRRTQKEAREHYLRSSPKGWHADEVKAALGR
jgi:hypothetical protein